MMEKPVFTSQLSHVLDLYSEKCLVEHKEKTLPKDFSIMKSLDTYLTEIGYDGGEISLMMLTDWVTQYSVGRAPNTVAHDESIVAKILRFASTFGISSHMPEIMKSPDDYQPYIFTQSELTAFCEAADNITYARSQYPWIQAEIPMLTRIYIGCGTRTTETLLLQMKDVDLEQGVFTMRKTKRDIERLVPFTENLRTNLNIYCRGMGIIGKPDAFLFPGKTLDSPLPGKMYLHAFEKMMKEVGIKPVRERKHQRSVCPYCFRHTFACFAIINLKKQGIDVSTIYPFLSTYMGHEDLYSTEAYLKFTEPMVSEELKPFENNISTVISGSRACRDTSEWI